MSRCALDDALPKGRPETSTFNTDQGAQFTSAPFTDKLEAAGVRISMDGRWLDNVFVERLWRSLKDEEGHLKGYADGLEARIGIGQWFLTSPIGWSRTSGPPLSFVVAPLDETENHAQQTGNPGSVVLRSGRLSHNRDPPHT